LIAGAAVAWSSAGVLQRQLSIDTPTQIAARALVAFFALAVFVALTNRGSTVAAFRTIGRAGLAVAVFMSISSGSFIIALNHSTVANVLFIQAAAPVAAALIAWVALREAITRRAGIAMAVALIGVALMVGGPDSGGPFGIVASIVMTLSFAVTIVIARHKRDVSMGPAICLSQLIVFLIGAPFAHPTTIGAHDFAFLVLMGVCQMALGLAFLTAGARLIPASEVALITLLEVVLGPLWVWISVSETPVASTLIGGAVVIVAVLIQTMQRTPASAVHP
jgi:drug/metabolite transporter (DMT)-like permease